MPASAVGAPGHPYGQEKEVITPLNVRDPAALVMPPAVLDSPRRRD